jgi:hypothetical protein
MFEPRKHIPCPRCQDGKLFLDRSQSQAESAPVDELLCYACGHRAEIPEALLRRLRRPGPGRRALPRGAVA